MREIGFQLIASKKEAILSSSSPFDSTEKNGINAKEKKDKDILSLIVRSNLEGGGEEEEQRLSDEQIVDQIPTFLVAGELSPYKEECFEF